MGFHPEGVGKGNTPALNRERKRGRVREGAAHAALVFDGEGCVGWCQFGVADEVPRIKSRAAYEKGQAAPPDWRIACCYVGKGHRRQGVAAAALAGALDLIAGLGALSTYEKLGFTRDRKIGKHRWVVTRVVEPIT
jgi:GNAT superfamily N-acetyltransferase